MVGEVAVGEAIVVRPGDKLPLDGRIVSGTSEIDQSPITGESLPVVRGPGDEVFAGSLNGRGAIEVEVTRLGSDSALARIITLVERAQRERAPSQAFVDRFARRYTPAVTALAVLLAAVPPLAFGQPFGEWLYRALVLLVISCPCALVVSVPLGYFGGIGRASRRGILVKGSNVLDALAHVQTVIFDKTGTLTQGVFEVEKVVAANGYTPEQVLAFAAAAEMHANHPIGASIVRAFKAGGGRLEATDRDRSARGACAQNLP
jgi:Cd2+/Zn2+-exporting ATPase